MGSRQSRPFGVWGLLAIAFVIALLPVLIPVGLVYGVWWVLRAAYLLLQVRLRWLPEKRILLVYSNSPNWKEYIESNILPGLGTRVAVLNWSERNQWVKGHKPLEARVFLHWAGVRPYRVGRKFEWSGSEYNPLAIIFAPWWWPRRLRFWRAFRDFRHGKPEHLRALEKQLFAAAHGEETV